MKYFLPALRFKIFMTLLLGIAYPFLTTGVAQVFFHQQANGNFIRTGEKIIGAKLIGQKFEKPEHFWSRPSAVDYNPLTSGGSNLGPTSSDLKKIYDDRKTKLKLAHPDQHEEPPQELLFASASGIDPHISVDAAVYQVERIANATHLSPEKLQSLIQEHTEARQMHVLGEPTVNVLLLNLALERSLVEQR